MKIIQSQMEMIALAFSCLLCDVGFHKADWETSDSLWPDLSLGTGNNWWLKRYDTPALDGKVYLQARYEDWLENDSPIIGKPRHAVTALRMLDLCREIKNTTGIIVDLPFSHEEIHRAATGYYDEKFERRSYR